MTKLYSLFIFICCILSLGHAKAQKFSIAGSSDEEHFNGYGKPPIEIKNIVPVAKGYLALYVSKVFPKTFGGAVQKETSELLRLYDEKLHLKKEQELLQDKEELKAFDLVNTNNKIYFLYTTRENKILTLGYREIDPNKLTVVKEVAKLGEFDFLEDQAYDNAKTLMSADSSKWLFYVEHWAKKKEMQNIRYIVADKSMNRIYEKNYSFPYMGKEIKINSSFLGNDGSLYVLYSYYPGGDNEAKKSSTGDGVPYEVRLKKISKDGDQDISISTAGLFVEMMRVFPAGDGQLAISGLYKTSSNGTVDGAFITKFNSTDKSATLKSTAFPAAIKNTIRSKADFTKETPYRFEYSPADTKKDPVQVAVTGKEIFMFNQYHYPKPVQDEKQAENNSDVYVTLFKEDGEAVFSMIELGKHPFRVLPAYSQKSLSRNNKLIFLVSDAKYNATERGFGAVLFDLEGNVTGKKLISNDDDLDGYWLSDDEIKLVENNSFIIQGISGTNRKLFKVLVSD